MNRSLNVRFIAAAGSLPAVRLPVSITRLSQDMRTEERQELMVPVAEGMVIRDLSPGTWLVKARLPSGESLTTTARVAEDDAEAVFDLEGLGRDSAVASAPKRVTRSALAASPKPSLRLLAGKRPRRTEGQIIEPRSSLSLDGSPVLEAGLDCDPRRPWWLTLAMGESVTAWRVPPAARGGQTRARVRQVEGAFEVDFDFGNEQAAALLCYLENTSPSVARRVGIDFVEAASELLEGKAQDVTSAIVAGYFLWRTVDWREGASVGRVPISRLKGLLHNLAMMKGPESDGPIIYGHWLLDAGRVKEARAMLLEAQSRGVPLFAMGLRALSRGLGVLHASEQGRDPKLAAALVELSKVFQKLHEGPVSVALDLAAPV